MQIIDPFHTTTSLPELAACIGFFDGVHRGHRFLIRELNAEAKRRGLASAVITFRNHPRELIDPEFHPQLLQPLDEKMASLAQTGLDYCIVLDFTPQIRDLSAEAFIQTILCDLIHVKLLLIGYDHRFGKERRDGFEQYKIYGAACGVDVMKEPDYSPSGLHVSSSAIRRALLNGKPELAAQLLGTPYRLTGTVVKGSQIGRTIGFPTANVQPISADSIIPKQGVYAAFVKANGRYYPAMVNIGNRPTVEQQGAQTVEAHLIGFEGDLYGAAVSVFFMDYLRPERKMESIADLKQQLQTDRDQTLICLDGNPFGFKR